MINLNYLPTIYKNSPELFESRKLKNSDFALMTNEDFEVAFNTSDRNNNQQFALLFTPLAQNNMLNILKDSEVGYGDDFDFKKYRMINTIISDHMQQINLDMNPERYRHFDFDAAKKDFYNINAEYFRAIYFSLAPLLCIPAYQQVRPAHDIYGTYMKQHSSFWEHEALANFWGQDKFRHPQCVTDCILKTSEERVSEDASRIKVYAHGYMTEQRVTYKTQLGGDGRMHNVPVYWDEYILVTGSGTIQMEEDNQPQKQSATHSERLSHINNLLSRTNLDVYRRNIASRID